MRRICVAAIALVAMMAGTAWARSIVMIDKRQSTGVGYPIETTNQVKLPDGKVAQLITCCGLARDDSAIYTVRDADGYTIVDHKFAGGRFVLTGEGRLIWVQKSGPSLTITFHDVLLRVIKQINLVDVRSLVFGDKGSVAALIKLADGPVLRIYDSEGQNRWELKNPPLGSVFLLPKETHVAVAADKKLSVYPLRGGEPQTLDAGGTIQLIGSDAAQTTLIVSVDLPTGPEVWALDQASLAPKWKHPLTDTVDSHCRSVVADLSRTLPIHRVIALLLRCPSERRAYYAVQFLTEDGQLLGQEKLGERVETTFFEVKSNIAIVSDGFLYNFAVKD